MKKSFAKSMIAAATLICTTSSMAQTFAAKWNQFYNNLPINQEYIDGPSITPYGFGQFYHNCGGNATMGYFNINRQNNVLLATMNTGGYMTGLHVNNNQLLCSKAANENIYPQDTAVVRQGMIACPIGKVMTGLHVQANKIWCAEPVGGRTLQTWNESVNYSTGRPNSAASHMHACPVNWVMTGVHVGNNAFLCTPMDGTGINPWDNTMPSYPLVGPTPG